MKRNFQHDVDDKNVQAGKNSFPNKQQQSTVDNFGKKETVYDRLYKNANKPRTALNAGNVIRRYLYNSNFRDISKAIPLNGKVKLGSKSRRPLTIAREFKFATANRISKSTENKRNQV